MPFEEISMHQTLRITAQGCDRSFSGTYFYYSAKGIFGFGFAEDTVVVGEESFFVLESVSFPKFLLLE